jgi:ribosome maturation factor RimP
MSEVIIEDRVRAVIEPQLEAEGIELVDLEYVAEYGTKILRLFVDNESGIGIDEITRVSREVSMLLDVEDLIEERYSLEVSSPGLARPLVKPAHFANAIGKAVKIKTKRALNNRKNFKGVIKEALAKSVTILTEDGLSIEISLEDIEKARLEIEL